MNITKMVGVGLFASMLFGCELAEEAPTAEVLLSGGLVYDGSGGVPIVQDVAVSGNRITFVGDAAEAGITAAETLDVSGLIVTPGFIDMHSHSVPDQDYGRESLPFIYQGITTVSLGLDGDGTPDIAETFENLIANGMGANAFAYVGHGEIRERVMGTEDRAPTGEEFAEMQRLVRKGMDEGAFGLSSGLFYVPGYYAETEEVIELAKIASEYGGIYDTHDRDLGATYKGIGYLNSIREGIEIGEKSGARVIFSHFNAQGVHNYGRAGEGAALINEARARGVEVAGAQHVYDATQSSLQAYALPRWAAAGGVDEWIKRFDDPEIAARLDVETAEMLEIRGGAERIKFIDPRPHLNGRTLAELAAQLELPVPATVREILRDGNAGVMNLGLYDPVNTRLLAQETWMMTCTDGRDPRPDQVAAHPRVFGAFTKKIREYVIEEELLPMEFVIRSMTGLAADFLRLTDRGYVREGAYADLAVFDVARIRDVTTYEDPKHFSEGTVHVLVNGTFALKDNAHTGALAGSSILRGGEIFQPKGAGET